MENKTFNNYFVPDEKHWSIDKPIEFLLRGDSTCKNSAECIIPCRECIHGSNAYEDGTFKKWLLEIKKPKQNDWDE